MQQVHTNYFRQFGSGFIELLTALLLISVTLVGVTTLNMSNLQEIRDQRNMNHTRSMVQSLMASIETSFKESNRALYQASSEETPTFIDCTPSCTDAQMISNQFHWFISNIQSVVTEAQTKIQTNDDNILTVSVKWTGSERLSSKRNCLFNNLPANIHCNTYSVQL